MNDAGAMTDAEWKARQDLAATYRIFAMMGWDELIYTHITVKVPGEDGAFLINPFGLQFSEVTASNLVKIDIDGNKLCGSSHRVNKAGFVQHSVFHRHLPDANCIVHTHTTAIAAVCCTKGGLQPVNFYACGFMGKLSYHDFEGVTVREDEGERLIANLGDNRVLMLRNHGAVVIGESLAGTLVQYWALQRACEIQLATMQAGEAITIPQEVIDVHQRDLHMTCENGTAEFDSWVRQIDKIDTSWRT
ncbi:MAG: class II aldolase/adducin family protein [Myxococcota bacterium]